MQAERIALKIQWAKDVRRVTIDKATTFSALLQTLRSIFKAVPERRWKNTAVKYQDDEGDMCTITSDEELQEAISLCLVSAKDTVRPLLRLSLVSKAPKVDQPQPQPQQPQTPQNAGDLFKTLFGQEETQLQQFFTQVTQQFQQHFPVQPPQAPVVIQEPVTTSVPLEPIRFRCGARNGFNRFHQLRTKSQQLHDEGIKLMDENNYLAAREVFVQQLDILHRPWHRASPLYNIACCDALLGDRASALSFLEQAISAGFVDVEHILGDEDLKSLRDTEEFSALLTKAREGKPQLYHGIQQCQQKQHEWFELQQKALNLMAVGTVEAVCSARDLLTRQAGLSSHPHHQRIPLYNIACCEALLGRTEEAFKYLKEAITAGYRNLRHMETDEDLKSLRDTEQWKDLVKGLKATCRWWRRCPEPEAQEPEQPTEDQAPQEPVEEVKQEEIPLEADPKADEPFAEEANPSADVDVPVPAEYKEALEVLVAMGFSSIPDNLAALVSTGGDVTQALELLI